MLDYLMKSKLVKKDIIICKTEQEEQIANLIIQKPPACWGKMPVEVRKGTDIPKIPVEKNGCMYEGENRYIPFPVCVKFWLEDGYNIF